jgi:hypothetical protein
MASLIVRHLAEETKQSLAARAQARGKSLEAEVRDILDAAARDASPRANDEPFGTWLVRISRPGFDDLHAILEQEKVARKARGIPAIDFGGPEFGPSDTETSIR